MKLIPIPALLLLTGVVENLRESFYGFKNASAITQTLKRLEHAAQPKPALQNHMKHLTAQFHIALSSVKR